MKQKIIDLINKKYNLELKDLKITNPPKKQMGDLAFNCGILAKELRKNPVFIAKDLKDDLEKLEEIIEVNLDGAFVNLKVDNSIFTKQFLDIIENDIFKDEKEKNKNQLIIVDYIGANIGKPLHIGHMCTPNLGQTMINIYRQLGYNVIGDNHLGDWGIIFGKLIFAYKYFGEKREELERNPIEYLLKLYVDITTETEEKQELEEEFRKTFKKLSSGDKEYIELWKLFTSYSVKDLKNQLKRLNVKPDYNIGESFFEGIDLPKLEDIPDLECDMKCVVKELIEKKVATQNDDNSVGVVFDEKTKISSCILQKRDGTHGYLASDLSAVKYRVKNWNPEKIIYFTDNRQNLHFKQVFEISRNAGFLEKTQLFHADNGFISLKDGAMSTRKGRIIKLDKLLDEAEERARKIILEKRDDLGEEELDNLSRIIGIGAIKYGYLKKNRQSNIVFDWDEFMTFEGNSGPYIQYAYVRARRILEKSNLSKKSYKNKEILDKSEEIELIKKILEYKKILIETTKNNYPHILASYIYELTKIFNSFYNNVEVLKEKNEDLRNLKLLLVLEFSKILKESFELLGIEMPDKM